MKTRPTLPALLLALAATFVSPSARASIPAPAAPAPASRDVVADNLNPAISPGDDFFEYANGGWLMRNPIPAAESRWGIGQVVREQLYASLRKINEQGAAAPVDDDARKVGDFWVAALDPARAEQARLRPLAAELARVDAVTSAQQALDVAFAWQPLDVSAFFDHQIYQDERDSDRMALHLVQGGLGLPNRDYYFKPEPGIAKVRAEYPNHLARVLVLLGRDPAAAQASAQAVMAFETELARASRSLAELRDPPKNYNKMAPGELTAKYTPAIAWPERIATWKLHPATVIVGQPEFFTALNDLLAKTPVPVLQDYLRLRLLRVYSPYLGAAFVDEDFRFYGQTIAGAKQLRDRWKRVLDAEEAAMGMVLGKRYVAEFFSPAAKHRYEVMVEAIRNAYLARIDRLDWMSDATKARARTKLTAVVKKVGYPEKWKDYSTLVITRESYCANMMSAARWEFADQVRRHDLPVDRTEWDMTPQTYNAYYNPSNNEIVLPAAQFTIPGFADAEVDDAVAYGYAAASTIGHEITHGFDDEGRQFDEKGNLTDWWTPEDAAKFNTSAAVLARQFSAYEPLPGLHINGEASLGENLADLGGVLLGLDAFKHTQQYKKGEKIAGLTPVQRYYLGYALSWLSEIRPERLRNSLLSDVHAPAKWRVLGPLSNDPQFFEAFNIKPGQPMYRPPQEQVHLW